MAARRRGRALVAAGGEQRWGWSRGGGEEAGATEMDEGMEAAGRGLAAAHRRRRGSAPVASCWMAAHRTNPRIAKLRWGKGAGRCLSRGLGAVGCRLVLGSGKGG